MKKAIIIFLAVCTAAGIIALFWRSSRDLSLSAGDYEILAADIGPVVQTIPASGIVEPENEVLLLSPAASIIMKVEKSVGSNVRIGDVILRMDPSPVQEQIERIQDELTIKRNNLERTQLNARSTRVDLDYDVEVKKLTIASLKSELADQVQLLEVGGISPARHEKTKQELVLAEKDLQTIYEKNSIRLQQLIAEERGLKLQIEMQEKELADKMLLLEKMAIRAPSAGIILEIRGQAGEKVNNDQMLVRMSDLSSFKIRASIDANQDDLIKTGRKVLAILDQQLLPGRIGNINPEIREKKIEFDVSLNQSSYSRLRPNLTVDLLVVRAELDSVLRLPNHAIIEKGNTFEVFVVAPGKAVSHEIKTGLRGDDFIEIQRGIEAGDRILVSEVPQIRRMKEVAIQ
jgi:HlyD family secretion protein